jgi:Kef-type K+ transport system membrane component KefB
LHLHATTDWINFLAMLGSGVLTFLAGAEIDPVSLKANLRASLLIGVISFAAPFVLASLAICAVRPGLVIAGGANRRHRSFHDVGGGRLRCNDRGWLE